MKDRFMRGIIAGIVAYMPTWVYNHAAYSYFHFTKVRFYDFTAMMIYGYPIKTSLEAWFARFGTMFFLAFCGAILSLIIPFISSRFFYFKAWFFSATVWFLSFAITKLFKITLLSKVDLKSAVSNLIAATIWGLAAAFVLRFLNNREII